MGETAFPKDDKKHDFTILPFKIWPFPAMDPWEVGPWQAKKIFAAKNAMHNEQQGAALWRAESLHPGYFSWSDSDAHENLWW